MKQSTLPVALTILVALLFFAPNQAGAQVYLTNSASGTATPPSGPGDLTLHVSCDVAINYDGWLSTDAYLFVNWTEVAHEYVETFGYYIFILRADIGASISDRELECMAVTSGGTFTETVPILGAGPNAGTLKVSSFIPYNWVGSPENIFGIFAGDNRSFAPYNVSSRTDEIYTILNPAVNSVNDSGPPLYGTGLTEEYDALTSLDAPMPFGRITPEARNDWVWGPPLKTRWGQASTNGMGCQPPERLGPDSATRNGGSTNRVHCFGAIANPLIGGSPDIDWDLTFTFRWGDNRIHYTVEGCHDGFPAYEAYMNNSPLMQHSDNGRISSLFPPCDRIVYETGDIF